MRYCKVGDNILDDYPLMGEHKQQCHAWSIIHEALLISDYRMKTFWGMIKRIQPEKINKKIKVENIKIIKTRQKKLQKYNFLFS